MLRSLILYLCSLFKALAILLIPNVGESWHLLGYSVTEEKRLVDSDCWASLNEIAKSLHDHSMKYISYKEMITHPHHQQLAFSAPQIIKDHEILEGNLGPIYQRSKQKEKEPDRKTQCWETLQGKNLKVNILREKRKVNSSMKQD